MGGFELEPDDDDNGNTPDFGDNVVASQPGVDIMSEGENTFDQDDQVCLSVAGILHIPHNAVKDVTKKFAKVKAWLS